MDGKPVTQPGLNLVGTLIGAILILLGIAFLMGRFLISILDFDLGHYAWPLIIIVPGVLMFLAAFVLERQAGVTLAMFGGMVSMTGIILMIQNLFDLYATWAYAWTLIAPTSMGMAKLVYGAVRGWKEEISMGLTMAGIGAAMFLVAGAFFELIVGLNGFPIHVSWLCWPSLLIGGGVITLIVNLIPRRTPPSA
ncbi:MAG TPA: hypothetical protein VK900_00020 [Anaerolineales bacterium]|nr:hypothetical protein [Anaerolineales bacterium]